jgi:hypothetical protein
MSTSTCNRGYGRRVSCRWIWSLTAAEVFGKRLRVVCGDTVIVETNPATIAVLFM